MIGTDATEARLGGYSGPGNNKISILAGIKEKTEKITGKLCSRTGKRTQNMEHCSRNFLSTTQDGKKVQGLYGEYFNNVTMTGEPVLDKN